MVSFDGRMNGCFFFFFLMGFSGEMVVSAGLWRFL